MVLSTFIPLKKRGEKKLMRQEICFEDPRERIIFLTTVLHT